MSFDSFSGVSARLREQSVASSSAIDAVLAHLRARKPGQPIEFSDIVGPAIDRETAERILNAIVDDSEEDLLERRSQVACPKCGTLEDADDVRHAREEGLEYRCTVDGVNLADPGEEAAEVPAYFRLT